MSVRGTSRSVEYELSQISGGDDSIFDAQTTFENLWQSCAAGIANVVDNCGCAKRPQYATADYRILLSAR